MPASRPACRRTLRGIVSCSGTLTENIAIYVEHHIKNAGKSHSSYLEDTPDFLRHIEHLNNTQIIPDNAMLVVLDVIGLYDNIPPDEGVHCVGESLEKTGSLKVPVEFIMRILNIIQDYSVFEFDKQRYQQQFGTSMGSKPAPSYANTFMAEKIDPKIQKILEKYTERGIIPLKFMKRFLDDIFLLFCGTVEKLHQFFVEINNIHKNIKFTMSHTTPSQPQPQPCSCPPTDSIPYLDTSCKIKNGKIITDLYRKPTDKNQYLLTSSCHPLECLDSIPFSLSMRINRVCAEETDRDRRFKELKEMLLDREYSPGIVDAAIAKARAIPRQRALQRVSRQNITNRPVFVVYFDPRLPSIPKLTRKHWRSMVSQSDYLKEVYPEPPLVSYKRQQNIREKIIRAKVAPSARPTRYQNGMRKCGKCLACSYVLEVKKIQGKDYRGKKFIWSIGREHNCNSKNIIYLLQCDKDHCKKNYIGMTKDLRERIYQHVGYARNKMITQATGEHFNLPGHSMHNMKFTVLEQVKSSDPLYAREREKLVIRKFNSFHDGINKEP
jgi:hypothetical protein